MIDAGAAEYYIKLSRYLPEEEFYEELHCDGILDLTIIVLMVGEPHTSVYMQLLPGV